MMEEFGFVYDSSVTAPYSEIPFWPYTLDYRIPHKCVGEGVKCPSRSFRGIWEMVMNQLKVNVSDREKDVFLGGIQGEAGEI